MSETTLTKYRDFRPTAFDARGLGCEDQQDWLVAPCSRTRDSDELVSSNWEAMIASLEEVDPDGDDHDTHTFGHWGPGWFEIALVRPGSAAHTEVERIASALADHPVLDEEDYYRREHDALVEYLVEVLHQTERQFEVEVEGEPDLMKAARDLGWDRVEDVHGRDVHDRLMDWLNEEVGKAGSDFEIYPDH
jgi:hypothetical protein